VCILENKARFAILERILLIMSKKKREDIVDVKHPPILSIVTNL
jgi:hypothetical protein